MGHPGFVDGQNPHPVAESATRVGQPKFIFDPFGGVVNRNHRKNEVRVELKYCEHCGGLWVREGGAGVYCPKCLPKVEDLPAPKGRVVPRKKPGKVMLPVGRRPELKEAGFEIADLDAVAGGVA